MTESDRIAQLEDEVRMLKAQLEGRDFPSGEELRKRRDTLDAFDNMPNGTIYRSVRDIHTGVLRFDYVSGTWEEITGVTAEDTLANAFNVFKNFHPNDLPLLMQRITDSLEPLKSFEVEVRYNHPVKKKEVWAQISSYPRRVGDYVYADGFIFDISDRKNIENALAESEQKYRFVFENTKEVFFIQDVLSGKIMFIGGSTVEVFGYSNEEIMKFMERQSMNDIIVPEYLPKVHSLCEEYVKKYFETGELQRFQYETQMYRRDGSVFWAEVSMHLIADETGNLTRAVGIISNIDERKRIEIELAQHHENLERLVHKRTDELSASNKELIALNEKLTAANEEISIVYEELDKYRTQLEEMVEEKTKEVIESESKQRFVFENMRDLYWIMDLKTSKFTFMAGAGYQMYGFTNEEIMQQELCELFDEKTQKKVNQLIDEKTKEYHETGIIQNFQFEELQYRKDGSRIWVECTYQLVPDETGEITQLVGIDRDVDERKRMEIELARYRENLEKLVQERTDELTATNEELVAVNEEMKATNEELTAINDELDNYKTNLEVMVEQKTVELVHAKEKAEESDKLKSAFLANMSHEIRTPLNGIVGLLRFIDTDITDEERHENIKLIQNCSTHLQKLINDIVDISKIEAHLLKINPVPLRLNELLSEMQLFYENYLQSENRGHIKIILDDSNFIDNCLVYADTMRLRQVLDNLIGNALKFTETGYICFGYRQSAPDELEFSVQDTGIGLAPNQLEVIFERFRQAETGNNRQYGGTGLGLTISRSLAQMMGGRMWVESTEGEGASFFFTISYVPIAPEDVPIIM